MSAPSRWLVRAACVVLLAPGASLAWAAKEAHGGAQHAPSPTDLLLPVINFTIFAFIVGRYLMPALREYLRRREEDLTAAATAAAAALTAAERGLADVQGRIAQLDTESASVRDDVVATARRQADRTRAEAEASGTRRVADAELLARQERRRALATVRAEVAARATRLAERRIRAALSAEDHITFVRRLVEGAARR